MKCSKFSDCVDHLSATPQVLESHCRQNCLMYRDNRSYAKAEERGKSIVFHNKNNHDVICYRLDGGVIDTTTMIKCDNLILFPEDLQAVFIELKGTDIEKAIKQIENAINIMGRDINFYDWHARIVSASGIPRIGNDPAFVKLRTLMKKHNKNATLTVRENKQTEEIPTA